MKLLGYFQLLDYSVSLGILLLRNTELMNQVYENGQLVDGTVENTDIGFMGTYYIEIPVSFFDVEIRNGTLEECEYVQSQCDSQFVPILEPKHLYVLVTNGGKRYYVGALKMEVTKNNFDALETSIGVKRFPV